MDVKAEAAVRQAAKYGCVLNYSAASAREIEKLIASVEHMARVALDLDDSASVGGDVGGLLDLASLGAYYGELLVRHAGAEWGEAEGEDGPEPAVIGNGQTVLPLTLIRRRVYDDASLNLGDYFQEVSAEMTRNTA